jgi:hypothetical protein
MYSLDAFYAQLTVRQKYEQVLQGESVEFYAGIVAYFSKLGFPTEHVDKLAFKLAVVAARPSYDEYVRNFRVCRVDDAEALAAYELNRDDEYCTHDEYVEVDGITYCIGCSWGD